MAKTWFSAALFYLVLLSFIINLLLLAPIQAAENNDRKAYIVYMGNIEISDIPSGEIYLKMMKEVLGGDLINLVDAAKYLLHSFKNFKGYVAQLTDKEAQLFSKMEGVVSVFPSQKKYRRTTRSWDFMGLPLDVKRNTIENDIIIGVLDTGIWPESDSFTDEGLSPPSAKWKGSCDTSLNFTCNNKIIGAQYFRADGNITEPDIASPRDTDGHGTHTASTVAGVAVEGASFLGLGRGTARGGVPSARIAMYKTCWLDGCDDADLLAAFDTAISDGVDIISISIGGSVPSPFFEDSIAIGAFHAMKNGILTSAAAGNDGPGLGTVENFAPWLFTVAASSIDRKFITQVKLGNGVLVQGISLNTFDPENSTFPLIYGGDAKNTSYGAYSSSYCSEDSLNTTLVKGKIVICDSWISGEVPYIAGVAGIIMQDLGSHDSPSAFPLPASYIKVDDGARVVSYARNFKSTPYGTILKSVAINDSSSPAVVSFSSRGPSAISPGILKPDLTAPGVSILAAYSPVSSPSYAESDPRSVSYNILSGTSMACPHVSGIAAYVKSFHPTWSPATIKSALMTTALPMSSKANEEAEFAYGSGHIDPVKALNPGLVYDAEEDDYVNFLCQQGLSVTAIRLITGKYNNCSSNTSSWDLNYPSMALPSSGGAFDAVFYRTVTNVGTPNSTYRASVKTPEGQAMAIKVNPGVLVFKSTAEKLSFTVRVTGSIGMRGMLSASLVWDDGHHQVRSPIVVHHFS